MKIIYTDMADFIFNKKGIQLKNRNIVPMSEWLMCWEKMRLFLVFKFFYLLSTLDSPQNTPSKIFIFRLKFMSLTIVFIPGYQSFVPSTKSTFLQTWCDEHYYRFVTFNHDFSSPDSFVGTWFHHLPGCTIRGGEAGGFPPAKFFLMLLLSP